MLIECRCGESERERESARVVVGENKMEVDLEKKERRSIYAGRASVRVTGGRVLTTARRFKMRYTVLISTNIALF